MKMHRAPLWMVVPAAALIFLGACASLGDFGRIRADMDVAREFEAREFREGWTYYSLGPGGKPDVILGVHPDYVLDSKIWRKAEASPGQMEAWVRRMTLVPDDAMALMGAVILDDQGRTAGVWYSAWRRGVVRMTGERRFTVTPDKQSKMVLSTDVSPDL